LPAGSMPIVAGVMATPNVVKVDQPREVRIDPEEFIFCVWIEEDGDREPFLAAVSATQAIVAGFGPAGPTVEWARERFLRRAIGRLENGRPIMPQMAEWFAEEQPFILDAD
jgi:hypothetical protein